MKKLKGKYPYNLLTEYFIDANNITEDTPYSIFEINAKELIVSDRIDLIAKMEYIDFKEKNIKCNFAKELYIKHIEAFSNGTYTEPGTSEKNTINKYLEQFDKLIDNIKNDGFDPKISLIPVGRNNEILDGAHRTSTAAYFNKKVTVIKFPTLSRKFDYDFFKDRLLEEEYLDHLVNKYCTLKENVYIACIWPRANYDSYVKKINDIIQDRCKVICSKEVKLSYNGLRNFMIQIYGHQSWVKKEDNFSGVVSKVDNCYEKDRSMIVYVLENDSFDEILALKQEVRKFVGLEKHSIHITDNQLESIQTLNLLFNKNSIYHLNISIPDKYAKFNNKIKIYKEKIKKNNLNISDFIVDSSGVIGVFGIRDCNDLDFLSLSDRQYLIEQKGIEKHDSELQYYNINKDSMIYDPRNYFVYNDLKFITLQVLKEMKKNRNEEKDKTDLKLIELYLKNNKLSWDIDILKTINNIKRKKRLLKQKIRKGLIYISKNIGVYDILKKYKSYKIYK